MGEAKTERVISFDAVFALVCVFWKWIDAGDRTRSVCTSCWGNGRLEEASETCETRSFLASSSFSRVVFSSMDSIVVMWSINSDDGEFGVVFTRINFERLGDIFEIFITLSILSMLISKSTIASSSSLSPH